MKIPLSQNTDDIIQAYTCSRPTSTFGGNLWLSRGEKRKQRTLIFLSGVLLGADWTLHLLCIIKACCKNHIVFKLQCTFYY